MCVIVAGPDLEAEGQDRADLALPGQQLALLQDVVAAGARAFGVCVFVFVCVC